ncbi:patatin-like phospholipase family protein [Palleronia caenipelagi]|uniref:Patatin-like phospholipase family protein n=1 Tax=Palleronia caenipelagi TaxID=2489174 RepID=A0A547Q5Z4_9RHOB|nr:patatin-like phospholipase family protein [Palleronia caenipelagi]TRD21796.1 patatin-like phospholipase family protein [Palleronia caenipelagi]
MAKPKRINIALQGGGAHGAFTWGVLDRLLDCDEIEIAGISGTSAGALNGAALKAGLVAGGREAARDNLRWLWSEVVGLRDLKIARWISPFAPETEVISRAIQYSPAYAFSDYVSRVTSPYSFGPFYRNPLERLVEKFHYDEVCGAEGPEFYVGATNVRSGKIRIFTGAEITPDALMASACLPSLFKAVEIDGEAYWDGGYTGNPALFPLFEPHLPADIVIVNINPLYRADLPITPQEIQNRINEISFNSSLLRELRAIRFVQRLIEENKVQPEAMSYVLVHMIADDDLMGDLSVATKLTPTAIVVDRLFEAGRHAGQRFLDSHLGDIGKRSSLDLKAMYD